MKLLLDESVPARLRAVFPKSIQVETAARMGWASMKNGDLLRAAAARGFDAIATVDRNMEFQQNRDTLPIPVVVMVAFRNRAAELEPLVPAVAKLVEGGLEKRFYPVGGRNPRAGARGP